MDRWPKEKIVSMKVILNMPKTQNRIHYSSQSTQYGYDIQSDDLAYKEGMVEMTSKRKQRSASTAVPSGTKIIKKVHPLEKYLDIL